MLNVSHLVNSVFTSRTYIIREENSHTCWLVDCGDIPPLIAHLSSLDDCPYKIKGVLLTHVHYDHIYGLPRLTQIFPDVKIITNEIGLTALTNPKLNMSKYHDDPIIFDSHNVLVCSEGMEVKLFEGVFAKLYETPGHHPTCLTIEIEDYLFTGDAYIPGVAVVTTLPGADKVMAGKSIERIKNLAEGKVVCPGHEV